MSQPSPEVKARYRDRHREELRAKAREYQARRRAADPEYAARGRERIRELTRTAPEHLSEIRKRSYRKHAERRRADRRRYYAEHVDEEVQRAVRRQLTVEAVTVEKVDRQAVFERDGGRCHLCGKRCSREKFDLDHLVPLSKGGTHEPRNVAVAHPSCNRSRGAGRLPAQLRLVG